MSLLQKLGSLVSFRSAKSGRERPGGGQAGIPWGGATSAGIMVTEQTALTFSAVWQAVRIISEAVASLPINVVQVDAAGHKIGRNDHPAAWMVEGEPNPEQSSFVVRETVTAHVCTWGNGYAEIERSRSGQPVALWPILPNRVRPDRTAGDRRLVYDVTQSSGYGANTVLEATDIVHVPGLSFDGIVGYSPIRIARENLGLAMAAEQFGASFFGNGARPSGVVSHPEVLSDKAFDRLKKHFNEEYAGPYQTGKPMILEEDMKWTMTQIPPEDAQFLQTRKHSVEDVARWFNLQPHKLGAMDSATFSNIEQQSIDFVTMSMRPWVVRFESELNRKLFSLAERRAGLRFAFDLDGLLRGDLKSRYESYQIARQAGLLNGDEIRGKEGLNPAEGEVGKVYWMPGNMIAALTPSQVAAKIKRDEEAHAADLVGKAAKAAAKSPPPPPAPPPAAALPLPADTEEAKKEADSEQKAFLRTAWVGFQRDGTVSDVLANQVDLKELTKEVGLPVNEEYTDPYLPVQAPAGALVSSELVRDADGDIIGAGVAPPAAEPAAEPGKDAKPGETQPSSDKEPKDGAEPAAEDVGDPAPPADATPAAEDDDETDDTEEQGEAKP